MMNLNMTVKGVTHTKRIAVNYILCVRCEQCWIHKDFETAVCFDCTQLVTKRSVPEGQVLDEHLFPVDRSTLLH